MNVSEAGLVEGGLPQNLDAERSVLGAVLLDPKALGLVTPILGADDFFPDTHRRIFGAMLEMAARPVEIDLLTLKEQLNGGGGGPAYISSLVDAVPDVANVEHYARIVKEKSTLRRLIQAGQKLVREGLTQEKTAEAVLVGAAGNLERIAESSVRGGYAPRCYSLQELSDNPPPAVAWRVGPLADGAGEGVLEAAKEDGLIQAEGITGLIGRPKIGKSFLLQYLQLCVAAGVNFLGRKTKPGRVLYIDEEMGRAVVFARWLRMRAAHPDFNSPETLSRCFTVSLGGLSIEKPDQIRAEIEKARPDLLIIDSFRRVYRGKENDSDEMARAMAFFAGLRAEFGFDVVLSHHTRKNLEGGEFWEDAARGSSDFFAACDGLLGFGKRDKGLAELRATLRAAAEPNPINLAFNPETGIWEPTTRQPEVASFDSFKAVGEILLSKPGNCWPQKLVALALQTDHGRSEKQAEKALAKIPTVPAGAEPPLGVRIFKRPIPGTHNQREVILATSPA